MAQKLLAFAAALLAWTTASVSARADEPRSVDWSTILVRLDRAIRGGAEHPTPQPLRPIEKRTPWSFDEPSSQNMGNAWFGVAPKVTLVARDWASSTRLAGDRMSLVEQMRLSESTRMVVGRARLSGARFTPFLQAGVGQWRVDRRYLPLTPNTIEIASQLGTGFEVRVNRRWQLAAETTMTTLFRENENENVPQKVLWSTFLASRIEF